MRKPKRQPPSGRTLARSILCMRETRRRTFDDNAERYAARRPTYPAALYDRMAAYGGLARGARILEVGPGTGQATRALAERGWSVTAVELGAHLAAVARRHTADQPHVDIVTGSFDDWTLPSEPFDAFFCATAFHWLDPATRVERAAASVRVGGTLAIVWTHHVAGGTPGYFTRTQACYKRFEPDAPADFQPPEEQRLPPSTDELGASPLVTDGRATVSPSKSRIRQRSSSTCSGRIRTS
ncbi:class I SAM-dependent methyltransferase [Leifsonia sp. 2MCAF36]|uniref:class I SAM-dependent methyltransferase n=1 Tax=Leifsonia sp. 2MCAF36 TaxID=3232988 RepID=UPI003F94CA39